MPIKSVVRQALEEFYQALEQVFQGDVIPMSAAWSHDAEVTLLGPGGDRLSGWDDIRSHYEHLAQGQISGKLVLQDVLVRVEGDFAYTINVEISDGLSVRGRPVALSQRATHVFRLEENSWKIIHRHTDPSPALGMGLSDSTR